MGRPEEPLVRDGSPIREFAFWLRDLRTRAGLTHSELAASTRYARSTLYAAFGGRWHPTREVTVALVRACGGDERQWLAYWQDTRRAMDRDVPPELRRAVVPPWLAAGASPAADDSADSGGWYVESVSAQLRLDTATPEAVEHRVIMATRDGLSELTTSVSVPRRGGRTADHGLDIACLRGGRLERPEQPFPSYFRQRLVLPSPLRAGERHGYVIRLRIPPRQPMAPHYVHVPHTRGERFTLRVHFDPARPPRSVRRLDGVPTAMIHEENPGTAEVAPDRFGLVTADFHHLRIGYGYGLSWQEARPGRG